jgi:hypothetical protein
MFFKEYLGKKSIAVHIITFIMAVTGCFSCARLFSPQIAKFILLFIPIGFTISFFYSEKTDITRNVVTAAAAVTLVIAVSGIFLAKSIAIINLIMCLVWILVFLSFALNRLRDYYLMMYVSTIAIISSIVMVLSSKELELLYIALGIFCWVFFLRIIFVKSKMDSARRSVLMDGLQLGSVSQAKAVLVIIVFITIISFPIYKAFPHLNIIIPALINLMPKSYSWDLIDIPRFSPYRMETRSKTKYTKENFEEEKSSGQKLGGKSKSKLIEMQKEPQEIKFYHGMEDDQYQTQAKGEKEKESASESRDSGKKENKQNTKQRPEIAPQKLKLMKEKLKQLLSQALTSLDSKQEMSPNELKGLEKELENMQQEISQSAQAGPAQEKLSESISDIIKEIKAQEKEGTDRLAKTAEQLEVVQSELSLTAPAREEFNSTQGSLTSEEKSINEKVSESLNLIEKQSSNAEFLDDIKEDLSGLQEQLESKGDLTPLEKNLKQSISETLSATREQAGQINASVNSLKESFESFQSTFKASSPVMENFNTSQKDLESQEEFLNQSLSGTLTGLMNQQASAIGLNSLKAQLSSVQNALDGTSSLDESFNSASQSLSAKGKSLAETAASGAEVFEKQGNVTSSDTLGEIKDQLNSVREKLDSKEGNLSLEDKSINQSIAKTLSDMDKQDSAQANKTLSDVKKQLSSIEKGINDTNVLRKKLDSLKKNLNEKEQALANSMKDAVKKLEDNERENLQQLRNFESFIRDKIEMLKKEEEARKRFLFWPIALLLLLLIILFVIVYLIRKIILVYIEHNRLRRYYKTDPRRFIIALYHFFLRIMVYYGFKRPLWMTPVEYRDVLLEKLSRLSEELQRFTGLFVLAKYSLISMTDADSKNFLDFYARIARELKENQGTFFRNLQASTNGVNLKI